MSNYYEGENGESGQPTGVMPPPPPGYQQAPGYPPPAQAGYGYEYGMQRLPARPRRLFPTETKPFYLTSEFAISLLASILIAITAASSNAFGAWRAWILITAIVVAYNISRGLAKAATRSHAPDPRDNLDLSRSHNGGHQQHQ